MRSSEFKVQTHMHVTPGSAEDEMRVSDGLSV